MFWGQVVKKIELLLRYKIHKEAFSGSLLALRNIEDFTKTA